MYARYTIHRKKKKIEKYRKDIKKTYYLEDKKY